MLTYHEWKESGAFFTFAAHQVFFKDTREESKPCLLLFHGFPTSSWDWHAIWPALTDKYRVICLDFLGYGFSDKPQNYTYSFFEQADIVEHLLNLLNIDKYHILAHDYGDTVAQEILARDNGKAEQKILSTTLLNGGIIYEAINFALIQRLLLSPLGSLITRLMTFEKFKRNFDNICAIKRPDEELESYWKIINHNQGQKVVHLLINYIRERKQHRDRWACALQNTQAPLQLIDGIEDPISGKKMVDAFQKLIPNGKIIELNGVGHYPQVEAPEEVIKPIIKFCNHSS